jgi:hypothetical protein
MCCKQAYIGLVLLILSVNSDHMQEFQNKEEELYLFYRLFFNKTLVNDFKIRSSVYIYILIHFCYVD